MVANPLQYLAERARYAMYGPGSVPARSQPASYANIISFPVSPSPQRQSWVFDSHILTETASAPQSVSLAWDERQAWGGDDFVQRSWNGITPQERKAILLDIYINNPWVSACIDVIVKRICSGGFVIEKLDEELPDNKQHYDQLAAFLDVNDDWDFLQYARASLVDELIYGECYSEILWDQGLPCQLIKVDCLTMGYVANRFGQIEKFKQQLTSTSEINWLKPQNIIRWWFPHPRASIDPFAPAEKVSDAVLNDKKMMVWLTTFFQKGAKHPYAFKFPGNNEEADRFLQWYKANYTGEKNAHLPLILWGGAEPIPLGAQGSLDMDFGKGLDRMRTTVFAAYGVPPAAVAIIESGNIGGGTGEDQDKSLQYNACDPVKEQWLEKLNYRIVKKGFGIEDYRIGLRYADYRSDENLSKVQDMRVRNGTRTINEARQEEGRKPYKVGGDVPIVVASKDVFPVPRFDDMEDEQKQSAQLDNETKQVQIEKIKNPPPPPPALLQPGQPGQQPAANQSQKSGQGTVKKPANKIAAKPKSDKQETIETLSHLPYTDDNEEADRLAETLELKAIRTQEQEAVPAELTVWEPPDVEDRLARLAAHKVATQEWVGDEFMCSAICTPNHGKRVKLGETFPGGQRTVNGHPHCNCTAVYRDAEGNVVKVVDDEEQ